MGKQTGTLRATAGVIFLLGALALGACASGGAGTSTSTGGTSSTNSSQQQTEAILSQVQSNVQSGKLKNAHVTSNESIQSPLGPITSTSTGTLEVQPFAIDWSTQSTIGGKQIASNEIIVNDTLYVKTADQSQYQSYSLASLAKQAAGSSNGVGASSASPSTDISALEHFLSVSNAHLVCGQGSASSGSQSCTDTVTVDGQQMKVYHLQGANSQQVSTPGASSSTTTSGASTVSNHEDLYINADGSYQPVEVVFTSNGGSQGSITSTTTFTQWNAATSAISAPTNVQNG